ncbi:helix-turn-helix domain-containing protein [Candidatus Woesearchaeota archaeon]|nr:helix-turn-helix domain-containing protein [Candidatus Woesearchaeota archaeon]MBL7050722.1 helix-turn-helix domain-containing protein [Candidatus Woesearchaeota archaeon]
MSLFVELIDKKIVDILEVFIKNEEGLLHLSMVAERAKVPLTSTHRIINSLVEKKLIEQVVVGKLKLYKLSKAKEVERLFRK